MPSFRPFSSTQPRGFACWSSFASQPELLKRLAYTAKAWGKAPSDYLPELDTYEAFALDEACAVLIAHEQEQELEKVRQGKSAKQPEPEKDPLGGKSAYEWMTSPEFKA